MTQPQEDTLRVISDPINLQCKLTSLDQAAIRAAMEERAELLLACRATKHWLEDETFNDLDELSDGCKELLAKVRAAVAKATGGQS